MGLSELEREVLNQFIAHLNRIYPREVRAVILYGSKARGDAKNDSDIDILLLVNDRGRINRDRIYDFILEAELEHNVDISLNIYDAEHFKQLVEARSPFASSVLREGEVLWQM
ncbi:nucleotidyltransferase domain-containing protein [Desulfovirgula thermocuniculi]|uniref:nucleotidyltransferase domain-containing protein n=1 Tax=Desulfovirgula thermocuniculi TaxID=348842 RepID=UPI000408FDC1|nr:nucleotidyltransferase domain-containing protein [Desulfovirgula thermocuniculi]